MSEIFENAVHSLQLGIEDFKSNDPRRPLSAIRNYYAGLLLLAKECLLEATPEAKMMEVIGVKYKPVPDGDGGVEIQPHGIQTVDLQDLKSRFKDFNIQWPDAPIDRLQKIRNNLEHLHHSEPHETVKEVIAQSFPMISGLFRILGHDPAVDLGDAWETMLEERDFFKKQKNECDATFADINWLVEINAYEYVQCTSCGSSLLEQKDPQNKSPQEIEGKCRSCAAEFDAEEVVKILIDAQYGAEDYISVKDGAEQVIHSCPECGLDTYVTSDDVNGCFWCESVVEGDCASCSTSLNPDNVSLGNSNFCAYCVHIMEKD